MLIYTFIYSFKVIFKLMLSYLIVAPQGGFIALHVWEIRCKKDLTFSNFTTLLHVIHWFPQVFRKSRQRTSTRTKHGPIHFKLAKLGTSPVGINLLKLTNSNTRTVCEICLQLTIETPERYQWSRSCFFIGYFEQISHLVLFFLFLTSSR